MITLAQEVPVSGDKDVRSERKLRVVENADFSESQAPTETTFPSPKLTWAEKSKLIYPYYAGFSEAFVASMLDHMKVAENSRVFDPWNGSGTTTLVASMRGASAIGYDLNPVLIIVARARAANYEDLMSANSAWERLHILDDTGGTDMVEQCAALYKRLILSDTADGRSLTPAAEALILCALFNALRKGVQHAKTRNPAWFSSEIRSLSVQRFSEVANSAKNSFISLSDRQARYSHFLKRVPELYAGDFLNLSVPKSSVDAVLTSPPYLTRLDYVKATLPELLLLDRLHGINIVHLRLKMMGSPLVGRDAPLEDTCWGPTALRLIGEVKAHPSKASSTYYLRFYLKYFAALCKSIERIAFCLIPNGVACLVSQRSHYKEIAIDLPQVIVEMAGLLGLHCQDRFDFAWNKSIAIINSRAMKADNRTIETAVILRKS